MKNRADHHEPGAVPRRQAEVEPCRGACPQSDNLDALSPDELRQMVRQLRQTEEIFQCFMKYSPIYVFFKDDQIRALRLSANYEALLGRPMPELLGKTMADLFPSELAERMVADDLRILHEGQPLTVEEEFAGRVYTTTKFPIHMEGKPRFLAGFTIDITERKRAEMALRESEGRHRAILQSAMDGFWLLDATGHLLDVNEAYCRMSGYSVQELRGMCISDLNATESPEETAAHIRRIMVHGEDRFESRHRRKDGRLFDLEVSVQYRPASGGWFAVFLRDVTERKRAEVEKAKLESQLQQAQKMESVGRLAGGVAHDFNNMLQAILGNADLALEALPPDSPARESLENIQNCGQRSAELTRQLLAFARKQTVAPKLLDLNETVEGMLKMLKRLIGEDIDLAWQPQRNLWPVHVDPSQMDQILANLCVNARDAIGGVGRLTLETGNSTITENDCTEHAELMPGDYVRLVVSDTGCGMSKEVLDNIFEPFFTTKGVGEGTGLGLATVYGIVKQNNGFITVASEVEKGTTFTLCLPRHKGTASSAAPNAAGAVAAHGHETILLVEDEPVILELTTRMLKMLGYTVLPARSPSEAVALAREFAGEIHLLMTDVVMPEMNGRELARQLLSLYPEVRRLFMSGYTAEVIAHHGVLAEGVHFIQKPFVTKTLAAKVREALAPAGN